MEKMLNTGKVTLLVDKKLQQRKADSIYYYTNCMDWLYWIKDEVDFDKYQKMLESMANNWLIKPKEKLQMLNFFYPMFVEKVAKVKSERAKKNKKLDFECKPLLNLIWGY